MALLLALAASPALAPAQTSSDNQYTPAAVAPVPVSGSSAPEAAVAPAPVSGSSAPDAASGSEPEVAVGSAPEPATASSAPAVKDGTMPFTGMDLLLVLAIGVGLAALGLTLRRATQQAAQPG